MLLGSLEADQVLKRSLAEHDPGPDDQLLFGRVEPEAAAERLPWGLGSRRSGSRRLGWLGSRGLSREATGSDAKMRSSDMGISDAPGPVGSGPGLRAETNPIGPLCSMRQLAAGSSRAGCSGPTRKGRRGCPRRPGRSTILALVGRLRSHGRGRDAQPSLLLPRG